MIRTFATAVKYLQRYIPPKGKIYPGSVGIARMQKLMKLLGDPHRAYPTIHIGGTSGKGSTATMIAAILAQKYRVGLYTSPHLENVTERIKIGNRQQGIGNKESEISPKNFVTLVNEIKPLVEQMGHRQKPSYFEIVTAMAFLAFKKYRVDVAVIEVGLGGTFDATNVIDPAVSVLTNVGLDHTEILGTTIEEIAHDKVGIIKQGMSVVTGVTQLTVIDIVKKKCQSFGVPLLRNGHDFAVAITSMGEQGSTFCYQHKKKKQFHLSLLGRHQVDNAGLAIAAVTQWTRIAHRDIARALATVAIAGRGEIVSRNPLILLDGAHNPDKMRALSHMLTDVFPSRRKIAVIAIKEGKDMTQMLPFVASWCDMLVVTSFSVATDMGNIQSIHPRVIAQFMQKHYPHLIYQIVVSPAAAVQQALQHAKSHDMIVVTGSLYLIGTVRQHCL